MSTEAYADEVILKRRRRPAELVVPALGLLFVGLVLVWLAINLVDAPDQFLRVFLIGLTNGALYALVALGYTLVYGILELINFAHGDVFMLGGMIAASVIAALELADWASPDASLGSLLVAILAALAVSMVGCALINATVERVAYKPLRNAPRLAPLITAIGMSFILQNVAIVWKGTETVSIGAHLPNGPIFTIGGVEYTWDRLFVVLVTVPVLLLLVWLVQYTRQGKAMRATAQDKEAAAMMGIDVNRTISFTFVIAGALAGAAGVIFAFYFTTVRFDTGFTLGLIAFTAAVLGGIGNLPGAVLGAMLIGLMQAFNEGLSWHAPGPKWTTSIVFGILILILVFRPQGLLGEQTPEGSEVAAVTRLWRGVPALWRNAAILLVLAALLLLPAWTGRVFKADRELYLIVLFIAAILLGGTVYDAFWRVVDRAGVDGARARWRAQPRWLKALPLLALVVVLLLAAWAEGTQPSPTLAALVALVYVLYTLPARLRRFAVPAAALAAAAAYPILYAEDLVFGDSVPIFKTLPSMDAMVIMAVYTMMALGLNMVVGYAGLLDLGYVAFFALGAYCAAWLASPHFAEPDFLTGKPGIDINIGAVGDAVNSGVGGIHISIWLVLLVGAVVTALAGVIIGLPTLRLRGDYLAIVTLGFGEMIAQLARNGDADGLGFNLTNGPPGITPVDPPGFGGWLHDTLGLPADFLTAQGWFTGKNGEVLGDFVDLMYWGALALVLITLFCSIRLRDSRLGRAWIAIREDETAAAAMGIPLMRTKTWSYASGAFFGGIAGAWFGAFQQGVFPDTFNFNVSVFILCMVILGGMGNVWGVIAGAAFLAYLNTEGLANMGGWLNDQVLTCGDGAQPGKVISDGCIDVPLVSFGIYGIILVLVMVLRPHGIFPEARRKLEFEVGVHDEPLYDEREYGEHAAGAR